MKLLHETNELRTEVDRVADEYELNINDMHNNIVKLRWIITWCLRYNAKHLQTIMIQEWVLRFHYYTKICFIDGACFYVIMFLSCHNNGGVRLPFNSQHMLHGE